jgi:alkylated DNA repair dioxygenase AlkB
VRCDRSSLVDDGHGRRVLGKHHGQCGGLRLGEWVDIDMVKREELPQKLPPGFSYASDFLTENEERELLELFATLPFANFDFNGYIARRRIVEYGLEYDFGTHKTSSAQPIPPYLLWVRDRAANFAGLRADEILESIVTEYSAGAPIGWHRDAPQFGDVVGISLGSSCRMRFKPYRKEGRIVAQILEPRSIYVIRGPARWQYQHSIPAVESLRYSITLRTLREKKAGRAA